MKIHITNHFLAQLALAAIVVPILLLPFIGVFKGNQPIAYKTQPSIWNKTTTIYTTDPKTGYINMKEVMNPEWVEYEKYEWKYPKGGQVTLSIVRVAEMIVIFIVLVVSALIKISSILEDSDVRVVKTINVEWSKKKPIEDDDVKNLVNQLHQAHVKNDSTSYDKIWHKLDDLGFWG